MQVIEKVGGPERDRTAGLLVANEALSQLSYSPTPSDFYILPAILQFRNCPFPRVTSSRLCKYAEGASFPFQVESLEDGVDDAVHGLHVDEADHGPGTAANFDEATLDDVGGAQLAP